MKLKSWNPFGTYDAANRAYKAIVDDILASGDTDSLEGVRTGYKRELGFFEEMSSKSPDSTFFDYHADIEEKFARRKHELTIEKDFTLCN